MGSIRRGRSAVHSVASAGSNSFSQLRADTCKVEILRLEPTKFRRHDIQLDARKTERV